MSYLCGLVGLNKVFNPLMALNIFFGCLLRELGEENGVRGGQVPASPLTHVGLRVPGVGMAAAALVPEEGGPGCISGEARLPGVGRQSGFGEFVHPAKVLMEEQADHFVWQSAGRALVKAGVGEAVVGEREAGR